MFRICQIMILWLAMGDSNIGCVCAENFTVTLIYSTGGKPLSPSKDLSSVETTGIYNNAMQCDLLGNFFHSSLTSTRFIVNAMVIRP